MMDPATTRQTNALRADLSVDSVKLPFVEEETAATATVLGTATIVSLGILVGWENWIVPSSPLEKAPVAMPSLGRVRSGKGEIPTLWIAETPCVGI